MMQSLSIKIKSIIKSSFFKNGIWLYVLQLFNTVIPLITLPYITRVFGTTQYGVFTAAFNLIGYFQVITEYGFNLSGTRKVALATNKEELSNIYSRITISKLLLCFVSFLLMIILAIILQLPKEQIICMIILFIIVLGVSLQQIWFFQGMQVMKYITIISVVSRTISIGLVFALIKSENQIFLYSFIYSLTFLFIGIFSILIIRFKYHIKIKIPSFNAIIEELKDGWYLFTTSAMSVVFSAVGITVLGFTVTKSELGIFSAVQKIPVMITMIFAPISQIIFPYISKHYANSFNQGIKTIVKFAILIIPLFCILGILVILFSETIIELLYGTDYMGHSLLLIPLVCWMIISISNNFLGIQILVASGHGKEYSIAFRVGVIASLNLHIVLGIIYKMYGVAFASMISELVLTIMLLLQIKKVKRLY